MQVPIAAYKEVNVPIFNINEIYKKTEDHEYYQVYY
jgi:hypothetical protein